MVKAIALHSVVPVRSVASETSGMETQMLFAETCMVLEEQERWLRVQMDRDGETGWVDSKMLTRMNEDEWRAYQRSNRVAVVGVPMAYAVSQNNGQTIPLSAGSCLPDYSEGQFSLLGVRFRIDPSMVVSRPLEMSQDNLQQVVRFFLNTPYLWGGKNAMGMDCSGFTQVIYSLFGCVLPRNARAQIKEGEAVSELACGKAGDLVFFDHQDDTISHVGILLDRERVIHCSGRVKVERIDSEGIFSVEAGSVYTHHLAAIRRVL